MNKVFLFLFTGVVVLLLLGSYFFTRQRGADNGAVTSQLNEEKSLYENQAHGYTVEYPSVLQIQEYSPESVAFGTLEGESMDAEVEVRILTFEGEPGQSLQEVAGVQLMNLCAADGPGESFSCTDVLSSNEFQSDSGVTGFEYRLHGEKQVFASNEITEDPRGPFYVFPLETSAAASKVLVVLPPMNRDSVDVSEAVVTEMARSLQRTE